LLPLEELDGSENMAVDEAVLRETILRGGPPTLRLYQWRRPVVTIGYGQDIDSDVNRPFCLEHDIDIVRRPTGGKAVYHEADLTYAVVAAQSWPPFTTDVVTTYRVIADCLIGGLEKIGIRAGLAERRHPSRTDPLKSCCFAVPFRNELLVHGAKICGSAQLRAHDCFLQHGSILIDFDPSMTMRVLSKNSPDEHEWIDYLNRAVTSVRRQEGRFAGEEILARCIRESFEERMEIRLRPGALTPTEESLKQELLEGKYRTERWNREGRL
jgi:lipoate-protein ligase A